MRSHNTSHLLSLLLSAGSSTVKQHVKLSTSAVYVFSFDRLRKLAELRELRVHFQRVVFKVSGKEIERAFGTIGAPDFQKYYLQDLNRRSQHSEFD